MGATRIDLYNRITHRIGLPVTDGRMTTALVYQDIEIGQERLSAQSDWPWLTKRATFTTTPSLQTYALPSDHAKTLYFALLNLELIPTQSRALLDFINPDGSFITGTPQSFAIEGSTIFLAPIPGSIFTITHVYQTPDAKLVDDVTQSLVPDQFTDALVTYCLYATALRLHDMRMMPLVQQARQDWLSVLKDHQTRSAVAPSIKKRKDWRLF